MTPRAVTVFRILSALYAVLVFVVSSMPGLRIPQFGVVWSDKVAHFTQYAVFAFLVAGGWGRTGGINRWTAQWRPVVFMAAFAAIDEFHQLWVPRREASIGDWVFDTLGILVGFALGILVWRRHR